MYYISMYTGITNTLGRIMAGGLANTPNISALLLHNIALVAGGLSCILSMFCVNYALLCIFAAFFGLCIGKLMCTCIAMNISACIGKLSALICVCCLHSLAT